MLQDWYHTLANTLNNEYVNPDNPQGVEPVPDNALANGIGQHYCGNDCEVAIIQATSMGDAEGQEACSNPIELVLVNTATFAPFYVSLYTTGPPVRAFITTLDSVPVSPQPVNGSGPVFIDAAQRLRLSICRSGGEASRNSPVFVLAEMADASFDYYAPYNSTVAVLDFSGAKGGLSGVLQKVEGKGGEVGQRTLPWAPGADRVKVAALLAQPGLVPDEIQVALAAPPQAKLAAADMRQEADKEEAKVGAAAAAAPKQHIHQQAHAKSAEDDPARVAARDAMRLSSNFMPRSNPVPVNLDKPLLPPSVFPINPPHADRTRTFFVISNDNAANISYFYVNGISLQPPNYGPSLLERIYGNPEGQGYTNAQAAQLNSTLPPASSVGWQVLNNTLGTVVDLLWINGDNGEHPIHTHGP